MGLSASKRAERTLQDCEEFNTACVSEYEESLNLAQHIFSGVRPYQALDASIRIYHTLLVSAAAHPLVKKWVTSPPNRIQVDRALRVVKTKSVDDSKVEEEEEEETLDLEEFKAFCLELFTDIVVSNAREAILKRVPIGIAGIAGIGMATRSRKPLVGFVMGGYALGVTTAVYLSFAG